MKPFVYDALPGRIIFGVGSARTRLAAEIERLDATRVLLIASERERPAAEELARPFAQRIAGVFSGVRPHVPVEIAQAARDAARAADADCLLAIGGGSTTGTAKAIALDLPLPIVAVPTTYAGSEMTPIWGLTSGQHKQTGRSPFALPRVVVYDPELALSLPPSITGPSAMNAMAHCVEAFYAPGANPVTSLLAEEGIRALGRWTPEAIYKYDDLEARSEMLYGAFLGGTVLASAGSGLHHKICHVLGGAYNLPHAETHAVVLPHVVAFNELAIPDVMQRIAGALGSDGAAQGLFDLSLIIDGPLALAEIGMRREDLEEAVSLIVKEAPRDNPRPVDAAGVRRILEDAYAGRRPSGN